MKTKYQYITFYPYQDSGLVWEIKNNKSGTTLGYVQYYQQWKQYVFTQADQGIIFSVDCLQDIIHFISQLKNEPKN